MDEDVASTAPTPIATTVQSSTGNTPQGTSASQSGTSGTPSQHHSTPVASSTTATATAIAPHGSGQVASVQHSKRRRGLGIVTPNACTECRKKRAKCDGQKPCGRCKGQTDVECIYEVPVRQSKENLRTEIETLRSRQRSSDQVLAALTQTDLWEEVIGRLRRGHSVENISDWLGGVIPSGTNQISSFSQQSNTGITNDLGGLGGAAPTTLTPVRFGLGASDGTALSRPLSSRMPPGRPWYPRSQPETEQRSSYTDPMNWTPEVPAPPEIRVASWADDLHQKQRPSDLPRFRGLEQVLSPLNGPEMKSPSGTWTSITSDINLVQHLLALYFCWEYPTFASLSKEHFLRDFQDGRHRYCSPILVNALLALGCRFSTQPMTRANPNDPYSSGDHFFKESQRLFYQETDHHSLTTIQALGIMSIREASCGRDSESWYFAGQSIRLAIEMGLHRIHDEGDEDELAVQSATFWGAFALDHAWSLATGSLPQCSCFPHLPPKPAIIDDIEASLWVPYTDDGKPDDCHLDRAVRLTPSGAPLQRSCEQPSNVRSVYKCFCELSELVHQSLYILHSPGRPLTARDLLNIYTQYLNWYDQIPEVLRLGHNFTPAVLFAHLYYHFAILLLFRPLIKLRIIGSKVNPRDVCSQAADAIQGLLRSYSQLYTLRRTPSFVPYFVLTSAIMHLAIGAVSTDDGSNEPLPKKMEKAASLDPRVKESLSQGIADLAEMAPCHHFAEQALNILRYLAKKWNIDVDVHIEGSDKPSQTEDFDSLVRPYTSSLNFFAPNVREQDLMCDWGMVMVDTEATVATKTKAGGESSEARNGENKENPLFWPFPMQGRPILPSGRELEQAGFTMMR